METKLKEILFTLSLDNLANLESLKEQRIKLSKSFFKKICSSNSCVHSLLPRERI